MQRSLLFVVLTGCATVTQSPPPEVDCLGPVKKALASQALTACQRDSDCRGVSALLSGQCGSVVNEKAFSAHLAQFEAQAKTCAPAVQVMPECARVQPVCRAQRCTAEPVAERPECTDLRNPLEADAIYGNDGCAQDSECTLLFDRPTTVAFATSALSRREEVARACGTAAPPLFLVPYYGDEAFCVKRRCTSDLGSDEERDWSITRPDLKVDCLRAKYREIVSPTETLRGWRRVELSFSATADTEGRLNELELRVPRLAPELQLAFARKLHECRADPARRGGKPISVRLRTRITWMTE